MIDWIDCVLHVPHKIIPSGHFIVTDCDGVVLVDYRKPMPIEGTYSDKMTFKSQGVLDDSGHATELYFTGNPSKVLQGHNVFGSKDLVSLMRGALGHSNVLDTLEIDKSLLMSAVPSADIKRIDITESLEFESIQQVRGYIKQLSLIAQTRAGKPQIKGTSLYFQKGSKRWSLCIYSKGDEINKRGFHRDFEHFDFVTNQAQNLCRVELRIRALELKDHGIFKVKDATPEALTSVYKHYINRVKMSQKLTVTSDDLLSLSPSYRATYYAWERGINVHAQMTLPTYYRHRQKLLALGVDINIPHVSDPNARVIPLTRIVDAKPYQVPAAAHDLGLVYSPKLSLVANNN